MRARVLCTALLAPALWLLPAAADARSGFERQVVSLSVSVQSWDEDRPWTKRNPSSHVASAVVIGRQDFEIKTNQTTFPFEVKFDPAEIDPRHTYAVTARISDPGGRLLFINTTAHHVITRDNPHFGVDLVLDLVP